ncbi:sulfatase family protein [Alienimonas californiensis]|uniref:Arylsulfatase n=1 Tax=Alienimonas californiensis TaxID=2527989 RepID=A0A517P7M9_9PLAN|nr:sulfatase [Alienimonas californiensis]QDT15378.1 Arylsulfatase [Alienimonas californiensis]
MARLLALLPCLCVAVASAAERPNVVVFLSDDHTLTDSSLYGSTDLKTPQMERVAGRGMTFDRAFVVSPSCAPSRAALLTGLLPAHNGAEPNHARPRPEIKKLPAYFHDLGYEVVAFGKVAHYRQVTEYGFDVAKHFGYHDDVAVTEAIEWLKNRTDERPLCLFVGTNWPHVPWPNPEDVDPKSIRIPPTHVQTPKTRQARAKYYQAVLTMDEELGRTFDAAYEVLGENTLFVHSSDHGAQWPFGKWTLYDDGLRTPLIAVWPGKIAPGVRTDAMVTWVDLLPTLVAAAGGDPAKQAGKDALDGRSFLPVLLGETETHRDRVFATHSGDGSINVYPSRSLRDGHYKYILNLHPEYKFTSHATEKPGDTGYWPSWVKKAENAPAAAEKVNRYQQRPAEELYDVQADPHEVNNLAADPAHAERLKAMRAAVEAWMDEMGDQRTVYGEPTLLAP